MNSVCSTIGEEEHKFWFARVKTEKAWETEVNAAEGFGKGS